MRTTALTMLALSAKEEDAVEAVRRLTGGAGCDLVIETAGTEITTRQAIHMTKKGAVIVLVGYSKSGEMTLPMSLALDKELTPWAFRAIMDTRPMHPAPITTAVCPA